MENIYVLFVVVADTYLLLVIYFLFVRFFWKISRCCHDFCVVTKLCVGLIDALSRPQIIY